VTLAAYSLELEVLNLSKLAQIFFLAVVLLLHHESFLAGDSFMRSLGKTGQAHEARTANIPRAPVLCLPKESPLRSRSDQPDVGS
jgi:hypothetical protein